MATVKQLVKQALKGAFEAAGLEVRRRPRRVTPAPLAELSRRFQRYHLGCGGLLVEGFLNVDGEGTLVPGVPEAGVPLLAGAAPERYFLQHDLTQGIPAADGSLELIYHAHFLEHLDDREGAAFLRDCLRALRPGGRMRVAVPDLGLWIGHYVAGNRAFFDWYRKAYLLEDARRYPTNASVFMGMLYNWGHRMSYDLETLCALLAECGFAAVQQQQWGASTAGFPQLAALEGQSERRHESLIVECVKPATRP